MNRQDLYAPKFLNYSYEEYVNGGKNLKNVKIDHYLVQRVIGVGSSGSVYKGVDGRDKKDVAIKVMDMRAVYEEKLPLLKKTKLRLAETQPRLMQMCNSPCLLKCYDVYENKDLKVLVLQYCKGKTLQKEIDQKGSIPQSSAITILKHIMIGLMELHKHNIVHRDLKAENIMQHNGTYKIIDFGFSKKMQITQELAEVKGTALGTITTMAPEVMSRRAYGLKADIWSVGIIFFQMIYGIYPYDSSTALDMYRQIRNKKVFVKSTPESYNKITPSQQAYDFLKFLIVFDAEDRPNWKEVADHPFIKNSRQDALTRSFLSKRELLVSQNLDCDKAIDQEKMVKVIQQLSTKLKQQKIPQKEETKQKIVQLEIIHQKHYPVNTFHKGSDLRAIDQKKSQIQKPLAEKNTTKRKIDLNAKMKEVEEEQKRIKQLEEEQERIRYQLEKQRKKRLIVQELKCKSAAPNQKKVQEANAKAKKTYEEQRTNQVRPIVIPIEQSIRKKRQNQKDHIKKTRVIHLQCLKTEWIYDCIVQSIITHRLLDLDQRQVIEFLYLLIARCFNNMSILEEQLSKSEDGNEYMVNLKDQVKRLYNKVSKSFQEYAEKLTKEQDKTLSKISDFFSSMVNGKVYTEKEKFLIGIQNIEYSKQEQLDYTVFYFKSFIIEKIGKFHNESKLLLFLNNYKQINDISLETIERENKNFGTIVDDMLIG